jgi:dTDP-4-amino-4,6-dideoxygalactose transaminase
MAVPLDASLEPIPFNQPSLEGAELQHVLAAVAGGHTAAGGPFSARVSELLRETLGAADVLLTSSCTDALELTALLLDLGPDDAVIVPSFTFVTTALAFARTGAQIRFADIERNTMGIDPRSVESLMDERVAAVVPVHYAGIGCDLDGLRGVLSGSRATIIEDNAHGLYGAYDGKPLGSFGRCSTLSFHETKNFICGEGGAVVLNEARDVDRAHTLLDKGTNRRQFAQGEVDKYTWVDTGSSFGMSDLLAAFLLGQLEMRDETLAKRRLVAETYASLLAPYESDLGFQCMSVPDGREPAYHMFYVLLPTSQTRDAVLRTLVEDGVRATFHYVPLHSSPGARRFCDADYACPVTDDVSTRLLRLPFFNALTHSNIERVVETFLGALETALDRTPVSSRRTIPVAG